MSELNEKRWAVVSERGCEAQGLKHRDAAQLVRRLKDERLSGLCVITDAAARLQRAAQVSPNGNQSPTKKTSRHKRSTSKKKETT